MEDDDYDRLERAWDMASIKEIEPFVLRHAKEIRKILDDFERLMNDVE